MKSQINFFRVSFFQLAPIYLVGGSFFMLFNDEKSIIYQLLQKIIKERKELSKQYFDLKNRLDQLDEEECVIPEFIDHPFTIMGRKMSKQKDHAFNNNKFTTYYSFDRVSKNIVSILKGTSGLLSNKQILNKLTEEYSYSISLNNLTCNLLPNDNERSWAVQKVCRGYWQYRQSNAEGSHSQ